VLTCSTILLVVAELSITSQGEVLAQWVAIEAVIGHDTAQIRNFESGSTAWEPVGAGQNRTPESVSQVPIRC
jgi:hypothetical protein